MLSGVVHTLIKQHVQTSNYWCKTRYHDPSRFRCPKHVSGDRVLKMGIYSESNSQNIKKRIVV